jgi:hypothetical protein
MERNRGRPLGTGEHKEWGKDEPLLALPVLHS